MASASVSVAAFLIAVTASGSFRGWERAMYGLIGRRTWTMPSIESLRPPARSAWRTLGLVVLRCYLLAAIIVWPFGPSRSRWARARPPDRNRSRVPGSENHRPFG